MSDFFYKRFGQGPFPFPIENKDEFIEFYNSNGLNVYLSKSEFIFSEKNGTHSHDTYEFTIPSNLMPYAGVGDRCISVPANNILPINSKQPHGPMGEMHVQCLTGSHIDKNFLSEISYQLFNISNFTFRNEPLPPCLEITQLLKQFMLEARMLQTGYQFILECLSTQLVVKLLRLEKNYTQTEELISNPVISSNIKKAIEFLRENYSSNDYYTDEIASLANLSRYHFIRVFKTETGKTPHEYLIDIKIEKAKDMLKSRKYSVSEVCLLCGFTNHSHFSTTFKKREGMSPSEYRKKSGMQIVI